MIRDAVISTSTRVDAFTHIETATGANVVLGPYAAASGALGDESREQLVEVKNAVLGVGSKANHLSYIGIPDIGAQVNIGAGTITCNCDGAATSMHRDRGRRVRRLRYCSWRPCASGRGATIAAGTTAMEGRRRGER